MATTTLGIHYPSNSDSFTPPAHMQTLAGDVDALVAADRARLDKLEGRLVGYYERTTSKSSITTEAMVAAVSAPCISGHLYRLTVPSVSMYGTANGVNIGVKLKYEIGASWPTTSSPQAKGSGAGSHFTNAFATQSVSCGGYVTAGSTGTLRVGLSVVLAAGTGSVTVNADSSGSALVMMIEDMGVAGSQTGNTY